METVNGFFYPDGGPKDSDYKLRLYEKLKNSGIKNL